MHGFSDFVDNRFGKLSACFFFLVAGGEIEFCYALMCHIYL